jgi:CHAD domain-containing protein
MAGNLLSPDQRRKLEALAFGSLSDVLRRRAEILLLYDEGQPTRQIARSAGRSRGRVRYWRRQFRIKGMDIFPMTETSFSPQVEETGGSTVEDSKAGPGQDSMEILALDREAAAATGSGQDGAASSRAASPPDDLALLQEIKSPGVLPEDALAEAGRKVLRYHFAAMLRHEAGTRLGEDIEELHDMRVATRRMRAAFEVFGEAFKPKALRSHLKALRTAGRTLGRARDLDVFIEKAGQYLSTLPEDQRQGLHPLLDTWEQERLSARAQLVAYLDSQEYRDFIQEYLKFLSKPGAGARPVPGDTPTPNRVREIAPVLIYTRLAAVRAYGALLPNASVELLHALRIEFKKLRYTVEFFREVLGSEAKAVINDIKSLQDHLGDLNDAQVATGILNDFLAHWDTRQTEFPLSKRQNPEPIVAYLAYRHAERYRLMATFHQAWASFERPEFRRNLALAVSVL